MNIVLLDPSLRDHAAHDSTNLGDLIIYESVTKYLRQIFPNADIHRISTHEHLTTMHRELINASDYAFVGGTNILSSDVCKYHQWKMSKWNLRFIFPPVRNLILMGIGWWQYQATPTSISRHFYKKILSSNHLHSVRDSYTKNMLHSIGIRNSINTSCPTFWELHGYETNKKRQHCSNCLFTLTDYKYDIDADTRLIELILNCFSERIFFFPQGSYDEQYLRSLPVFLNNRSRITVLNHSIRALYDCIDPVDMTYIGTRLHGGAKCMQSGVDTLLVAVDNRTTEISRDINLPAVDRQDLDRMLQWLSGEKIFPPISLPLESINRWRQQFHS